MAGTFSSGTWQFFLREYDSSAGAVGHWFVSVHRCTNNSGVDGCTWMFQVDNSGVDRWNGGDGGGVTTGSFSSATVGPFTLNNEYLLLNVYMHITTLNTGETMNFITEGSELVASQLPRMITPSFTPATPTSTQTTTTTTTETETSNQTLTTTETETLFSISYIWITIVTYVTWPTTLTVAEESKTVTIAGPTATTTLSTPTTVTVTSLPPTTTLTSTTTTTMITTPTPATVTTTLATTETVTTSVIPSPPKCIIASAAYGSEMAPEVIYMRYVRDQQIGSTPTGRILRAGWNAFYYLWSPPIAYAIKDSELLRGVFRVLLVPLVGITHVAGTTFTALSYAGDIASVIAFAIAAALSVGVYIVVPVFTFRTVLNSRRRRAGDRSSILVRR